MSLERDVAREAVTADDEHLHGRAAADGDHGHGAHRLVRVGAVGLAEHGDEIEAGIGKPCLHDPRPIDARHRVGGEFRDEHAVGAVGGCLERDRRVGRRRAVERGELGRAIVHGRDLLGRRGGLPLGRGHHPLDDDRHVGGHADPPREEVEDERVAGLRVEREPVAVAPRVGAASDDGGQRERHGLLGRVVGFFLHRHRTRGHERGEGHWCSVDQRSVEVDECSGRVARREHPPGVPGGRAGLDRARLHVHRPFNEAGRVVHDRRGRGLGQGAADRGELHGAPARLHHRREHGLDDRTGREHEPIEGVVAAPHEAVVQPDHVPALDPRREVDDGILVARAAGTGDDGTRRVEDLEHRIESRIESPGPDLGPQPRACGERDGDMIGGVGLRAARDHAVGRCLERLCRGFDGRGLEHLRRRADHERAGIARAESADGDRVVRPRRDVGGDLHAHLAGHGLRLRVELRGRRHDRRGGDAGMEELEAVGLVEIAADERHLELAAPLPTRRKDRRQPRLRKLAARHLRAEREHRGQAADEREAHRGRRRRPARLDGLPPRTSRKALHGDTPRRFGRTVQSRVLDVGGMGAAFAR